MLLVIDVGNTNFVLGLYKKEKLAIAQQMKPAFLFMVSLMRQG